MPQVYYSRLAANDLVELSQYIANDKPEAAYDWICEVESTCDLLARNPGMGSPRDVHGFDDCRNHIEWSMRV